MRFDDTIFALASAPGKAAVAIVRISGAGAAEAVRRLTGEALPAPRKAVLRRLREPEGGGPPAGFAYLSPQDTLGVRIELVAGAGREGFLHWMSADERPAGS